MTVGIYQIKNTVNEKVYVGRSINIERRFYIHKWKLSKGEHANPHLQSAWNKLGETKFEFSILEEVEAPLLKEREEHWFEKTGCLNRKIGYNIASDSTVPMLGRKHSEHSKERMSKQKMGTKNSFYGKSHSEETKKKISDKKKGVPLSEAHKEKKHSFSSSGKNLNSTLSKKEVENIREEGKKYEHGLYTRLARKYNVVRSTISRILNDKTWRDNEQGL